MTEKTRRARMVEQLTELGVTFANGQRMEDSAAYKQFLPLWRQAGWHHRLRMRCGRKRRRLARSGPGA